MLSKPRRRLVSPAFPPRFVTDGIDLAVPLTQAQVDCACRVHGTLAQWRLAEAALERLAQSVPGFSAEACLLKTVAVNAIYGTQLLATVRMAKYTENLLGKHHTDAIGPEMVERIASLPALDGGKPRRSVSFASKFCHFFINPERFPIYDDAAREAVKLHLGARACQANKARPYLAFCANLDRLRDMAHLQCGTKELDRYLWLTGMFLRWLKQRSMANPRVNAELKELFQAPSTPMALELRAMLPEGVAAQAPTPAT